jgi:hypothetical protein
MNLVSKTNAIQILPLPTSSFTDTTVVSETGLSSSDKQAATFTLLLLYIEPSAEP